jgi:hypothetical protein
MSPTTKLAIVKAALRATKNAKEGTEDALIRERCLWTLKGMKVDPESINSINLDLKPMGAQPE